MKRLLFMMGICLLTLSTTKAQTTDQEISLITSILKSEIKVFYAQNLELTTGESELFWSIYDQYEVDLKTLSNERIKLLQAVLTNPEEVSAENLDKNISGLHKLNKQRQDLKFKYYKLLKKKVSLKVATQFYQIDSYLHTNINASLSESIPLIVPNK
ncbi:hypothetical protein [Carboxylicivirga sp. RSCT41]|uniref:hypothetical protein n=1 Tax=Carboxylicivirga agarovorans TaxID=3417570 RepID=UPI003D333D7D